MQVRDGYSTCFVTGSTVELESSIIRCFSEPGEWLLDLACGARQLAVAALEQGRSGHGGGMVRVWPGHWWIQTVIS